MIFIIISPFPDFYSTIQLFADLLLMERQVLNILLKTEIFL